MLKKTDIIELRIDDLVYGGEGIGKLNGFAVFVPDAVPGDKVKIEIISTNKNYARGIIKEIIEPSEHRIKPVCHLAKVCGGCQWQHINYEKQLEVKRKIVQENLKRIAHLDIPVEPVIGNNNPEYRCKVQYPVQQTKVSERFLAGYYKKASHEIVNIKHCCVQPEIINDITEFFKEKAKELNLTAYNEKIKKGLIRHLVYRYSYSQKKLLLIIVIKNHKISENLLTLCKRIKDSFSEIEGVLVNFNTSNTNIILGSNMELVCGNDFLQENLEGRTFKISSGSFFQVNPLMATEMFNIVRKMIQDIPKPYNILDVYSGVGNFSIWLKDLSNDIVAIEENPHAVKDARENFELNKANIEMLEGNADSILENLANQDKKFDIVILDPPRKGCSQAALDSVIKLAKEYIIYVSCNPGTLARDLKILSENNFVAEQVEPVDMFCHTYHVESIALLKKKI